MPLPKFISKLIGGSGKGPVEAIGDTVEKVSGDVIERKTANNREATERHKYDMLSDSWLSKNIRPGILAVSYLLFFVLAFLDGHYFDIKPVYTDLLKLIFSYALPFYYGGRFIEKIAVTFARSFKKDIKNRDHE